MINKIIFIFLIFFFYNKILIKFKNSNSKRIEYNYDFLNTSFEDLENSKKVLLTKKYLMRNKKYYDENSKNYHTFGWLHAAKKIGGANFVKIAKNQIINWTNNNYSSVSYVWEETFISKRLINLIYNYDFYAVSSNKNEKKIFKNLILKHFLLLNLRRQISKNISDISIESSKALLLFSLINKLKYSHFINLIKEQINNNVNEDGFHKSINPSLQAEYINHLYEIKNMCLFFKIEKIDVIEFQILNMCSLLKNLFHKDSTIALFNGSNNINATSISKINEIYKDVKRKELKKITNGLAVYDNEKFKVFFDITKPTNKLLNQNLHAGTLSIEMSYDKEKIITNCGSIETRVGKKPEFLRFSAAHSTIIINNTNISELVEKKSYKRIPKKIIYNYQEGENYQIYEATHDGYRDNFNSIVKRRIILSKNKIELKGEDTILLTKLNNNKRIYNIRFHLTPGCSCLMTNDKKTVIIKTISQKSWIFKSESKLTLEDSIYINDGRRINKTKQIVLSGACSVAKKTEYWSISKAE